MSNGNDRDTTRAGLSASARLRWGADPATDSGGLRAGIRPLGSPLGWAGVLAIATTLPLGLAWSAAPVQSVGEQGASRELEARITRLERMLSAQGLMQILSRLDRLQQEVQQLRGEIELQSHEVERVRKQQRDLYLDLDRRLSALQEPADVKPSASAGAARPTEAPTTPPAAERTIPARAPGRRIANADPAQIQSAYQDARRTLDAGQYREAIGAFRTLINDYPGNPLEANAQYWLGEAYYAMRDFDNALAEFKKVESVDADSPKLPDAMLKIGYIHYEAGAWDSAREVLTTLTEEHPDSTAARLAMQRLDQMRREGH